jgi:chemotaxis protein CheD
MTTVQEQSVVIGLGEYHVTKDPDTTLVCYGIGSCIAFAAHDPASGVVGMAHFVLPDSTATTREVNPARFCDTGVPLMLRELERAGADLKKTSFGSPAART